MYRAHVVVGTFVKSNGYDDNQQMLLLQIIFYGSSAILIIKKIICYLAVETVYVALHILCH